MNFVYQKIDPEKLIPAKTWLTNGALMILTGLLLTSALTFSFLGEKLVDQTIDCNTNLNLVYRLGQRVTEYLNNSTAYIAALRLYVRNGDAPALDLTRKHQEATLETLSRIDSMIYPESRPAFVQSREKILAVFQEGDRVIALKTSGRTEAALDVLDEYKMDNNLLMVAGAFNAMMDVHADRLYLHMRQNVGHAQFIVKNSLLPLTFISILIFFLTILSVIVSMRRSQAEKRHSLQLLGEQKAATLFAEGIINLAPMGYHRLSYDGTIIDMNQTELSWLGYHREEVVGKMHIKDFADVHLTQAGQHPFEIFQKTGVLNNFESSLFSKSGETIPVIVNAKAYYDEEGRFLYANSILFNFTERKKMEENLIEARQDAEKATQLKQLFMANMSHEIRTPLNAIIGFSNLLTKAGLTDELREYVENIQVSGNNLLNIVNDILDFEKIRSGMLHISQVEFDLHELVHSVTRMMRPIAADKNLSLHLIMEFDRETKLIGDPLRMNQILVNLIGNAIKFTENGQVSVRVRPVGRADSNAVLRVCFEVEDTGIGIPESEFSRIFERFTQAGSDTARQFGGTGLGLSLVKMLTELQQGTVSLKSRVGQGSTFSVEIPFHLPGNANMNEKTRRAAPQLAELHDLSGYHVLLAEDNPLNRRVAQLYLQELGIDVTQVVNGKEALQFLKQPDTPVDLVLMDIQMPEMDGYEATRAIRAEPGLQFIPIIAMTAHALSGEREKILACGMNDYLPKPIEHPLLVSMLVKYLKGYKL